MKCPRHWPCLFAALLLVAPGLAAQHFHKTECFCFHRQDFAAGEAREMPLVFTIDPALPPEVGTVSLAYTLFELGETRAN